jgi:5'-nucleotidase
MHFVLTNDDGYRAEGLAALYRAVRPFGEVTVVAPRVQHSIKGHAVTTDRPLKVERAQLPGMGPVYVCDGTPADCVRLAITELATGVKIDWVIAGINHGANIGVDIYYSGTVAAAREAAILGCPAIACSQYFLRELSEDWEVSTRRAAAVLDQLLHLAGPRPAIWNVTLPLVTTSHPEVRLVAKGLAPLAMKYERSDHTEDMVSEYRYTAQYRDRPAPPGTDVATVFEGHIAVTPLSIDTTNYDALQQKLQSPPV